MCCRLKGQSTQKSISEPHKVIERLVMKVIICRNTLPVPRTHQSSFVALYRKISARHGNKTWATHPEIHIHYRGMHAFHLQYGVAGAVLIFIPFLCFVCGVKACFRSLFWIQHVRKHIWTVPINYKWLSPNLLVQWTQCACSEPYNQQVLFHLKVIVTKGCLIVLWLLF